MTIKTESSNDDFKKSERLKSLGLTITALSLFLSMIFCGFFCKKPFATTAYLFEGVVVFIMILGGIIIYFLPSIIAAFRKHEDFKPIMIINVIIAWSGLFWIVALLWSMTDLTWEKIKDWWLDNSSCW